MDIAYLKKRFPLLMLIFAFGGIFGFIYEEIFYRFDLGEWADLRLRSADHIGSHLQIP